MRSLNLHRVLAALAFAAIYVLSAKLGLSLAFVAEQVTVVWPPTGIAIAALAILGLSAWPGIFIGAFIANITLHEPVGTALGIAAGNTLEAVLAVALMQRLAGFRVGLSRVRDVIALAGLGAIVATAVAATIGVTSLCAGGVHPWSRFGALWWVWWLGDAIGALVVAPVVMSMRGAAPVEWRERKVEGAVLAAALILVSASAFGRTWHIGAPRSLEYITFPFVIWAALRFGPRGAATATFICSGIAIWGTSRGLGPLAAADPAERLIYLQLFMAVVSITGLMLAAAIAENRERLSILRAIIDGTLDAVFVKDVDGKYLLINEAGARFLGKRVDDVLGRDDTALFVPDTAARIMAHDRRIIETAALETVEEDATAGEITRTYLSTKAPYYDADGRVIGILGVARDVTEQKRVGEALRENDRRKDEFLAMLAHELRNPLAPIRLAIDLLKKEPQTPGLTRYNAVLDRQVKHMSRMVDDLLDVSRVTRGKIELRVAPLDLAAVLRSAIEASRAALESRRHKLTVVLPDAPVLVEGDATRLEQVFTNLLQNAAKYTQNEGAIELALRVESGVAVASVKDNGVGIPQALLPRVFDLFTQADRSLARSEGGLGIGLTIVRSLVHLHGGSIEAESDGEERGSTFRVRLPTSAPASSVNGENDADDARSGAARS